MEVLEARLHNRGAKPIMMVRKWPRDAHRRFSISAAHNHQPIVRKTGYKTV